MFSGSSYVDIVITIARLHSDGNKLQKMLNLPKSLLQYFAPFTFLRDTLHFLQFSEKKHNTLETLSNRRSNASRAGYLEDISLRYLYW